MSVREDIAGLLHEFRMGTYNTENLNMAEIDLWKADQILSHPRIAILAEDQSFGHIAYNWVSPEEIPHEVFVAMREQGFKRIEVNSE